ncbi:MAG: glycoside hydrolase family 38 C-terminal domain-containing protein, partial [Promethearchaeota archaeon]
FQMGTAPLNTWIMYEVGRHPLKKDGLKTWNYEIDYEDLGDHIEEDEICPHVGNFFGKGDGGHGPTHQEVAVQNEYCKDPMFKWSRVHDFFKELEKWSERFPIWKDELYLENHRGTFSVHAEVKRYNRKNENMLVVLEGLAVLMKIYGIDFKYPYDKLEWAWKTTLKNQFHDVLPGSSIPEVYDDVYDDWMEQEKTYGQIIADVGDCLIEKAEQKEMAQEKSEKSDQIIIFLYNNLPWDRKSPIFIPVTIFNKANNEKTANIFSEDGKTPKFAILEEFDDAGNIKARYICQPIKEESENIMERMSAGWWAIPELPALSIKEFKLLILSKNDDPQLSDLLKNPFIISEDKQSIQLDNTITSLKISKETGAILELKSKNINNSENLLKGDTSNLTFAYVDKPKNWPAWNLEHYWKRPIKVKNNKDVSVKITENGPIFATIEINKTILKNKITQKLRLFKEFPEVYLEYLTNWDRPETILKVEYATSTNAEEVVSDIAYGAISRKTKPQTRADKARFEKIMHKYCDLSSPDKSWGIAIINEGKYAFDTLKDNETFRLTMLRSPRYPDPSGESWVHKERKYNKDKYNHKPPKYSGIGPFKARYKIVPHQGGALIKNDGTPNSVVRKSAEEFNQPVVIISAKGTTSAKKDLSKISGVLEIESENIYLGVLKLNEWQKDDSIILRLVEGCGIETDGVVKIHEPFKSQIKEIVAVDLLERDIDDPLEWDSAKGLLKFKIAPFEIKTFKIRT